MELQINPPDAEKTLPYLNACFPGWGDERSFRWVYQRAMQNQPAPDYLVLKEGEAVIAGSGVNYREVLLRNGRAVTAGIMTGSWTLPEARGKGCFNRMIQESVRLTEQRGGALLLAFVTQDTGIADSCGKQGPLKFPHRIGTPLRGRPQFLPVIHFAKLPVSQRSSSIVGATRKRALPDSATHRSPIGSRSSLTGLPRYCFFSVVTILRSWRITRTPLDCGPIWVKTERRTSISWATSVITQANGARNSFTFAPIRKLAENLQDTSFIKKPGYITVLVADWKRLGEALGQTAPEAVLPHTVVAQPTSPWFLGCWRLQAGDRM